MCNKSIGTIATTGALQLFTKGRWRGHLLALILPIRATSSILNCTDFALEQSFATFELWARRGR
jgi:hypothetical protein